MNREHDKPFETEQRSFEYLLKVQPRKEFLDVRHFIECRGEYETLDLLGCRFDDGGLGQILTFNRELDDGTLSELKKVGYKVFKLSN